MWSAQKESIIRIFGASGGRRADVEVSIGRRARAVNPAGERIDRRQVLLIADADILEALRVSLVVQKMVNLGGSMPSSA